MKLANKIIGTAAMMIFMAATACGGKNITTAPGKKSITTVEIDYGKTRPSRKVETKWKKGVTALEALETVAKVETYQVGKYTFVTSIDDVKGQPGVMAWYYKVNGQSAKKLAADNVIESDDRIAWSYQTDTCSNRVKK